MIVTDWLTIIGIALAIFAIYPSTERTLISLKLYKLELWSIIIFLFFTLYLIKFNEISNTLRFLQIFTVKWGFKSENWALIIFLLLLIYSAWRILFNISRCIPNEKTINYYIELIKLDFEEFIRLFFKYERKSGKLENYDTYKEIVFNPKFLSELSFRIPDYHNNLIKIMDNEKFSLYFGQIINNDQSIFYKELSQNENSYLVEDYNEFLFELLHVNPGRFIDIGGLKLIRNWYLGHLQNEKIKAVHSIYNQSPELLIDNYKNQLPLYFHIQFIELLYNEAIEQKIDISTLSTKYTNMLTIFSAMIEKIVDNLNKEIIERNKNEEYPTNYHYLISKIFSTIGHWFDAFIEEDKYNNNNSLVTFIPSCFGLCAEQLFKGYNKGLIRIDFVSEIYNYHLIDNYFSSKLETYLLSEINEKCIKIIPKEHIKKILNYCLNERLALSYYDFIKKEFLKPTLKKFEQTRLETLYNFLEKHNKIISE